MDKLKKRVTPEEIKERMIRDTMRLGLNEREARKFVKTLCVTLKNVAAKNKK